jgi:DNA-binding CsgD family transcriptional regulator
LGDSNGANGWRGLVFPFSNGEFQLTALFLLRRGMAMRTHPVIGRIQESARIARFYDLLPEGSRCLLLTGEAGIGKTTLLNWAREAAVDRGYQVLPAAPVESEVPFEFAALSDLFEHVPSAVLDMLPDPQRRAVGVAVFRDQLPDEPVDPRTLATAILHTLRHLAADSPVVLAVDDLPWLDVPSARVLSYVLRRARDTPLGLLATVRVEWSGDVVPLATDAIDADRVERITLGPMGTEEVGELLASRTGRNLGRSRLARIQGLCRGNPLFALGLAGTDADESAQPPGEIVPVPDSLRRLVKDQNDHLPAASRDVLLVAALTEQSDPRVVTAAAADPDGAGESLDQVVAAGTIVRTDGGIAFAHPLIRSVVIGEATPGQRRAAHRRLAESVRHPEERARHLALGSEGPDESIAAEVEEAASSAATRGACDTAATLANLAVSLTPPDLIDERHRRMALEAENLFEASDPDGACALLEAIIDAMGAGSSRAQMQRSLARYLTYRGDPMATWITRLTAALDESGDDLPLRADIVLDLMAAAINGGDSAAAIEYATQALDLVQQTGDAAKEAGLCSGLAYMEFANGEGVRNDLVERGLSGPEQPLRIGMELRPRFGLGMLSLMSDDLDGARTLFEQEYRRAIEDGVETGLPHLLYALVMTEAWAGNWERADQLCAEGSELAEESGLAMPTALMSGVRGLLHVYRGRVDEARRDGGHTLTMGQSMGIPPIMLIGAQVIGLVELSVGDAEAAHRCLGPLGDQVRVMGIAEPGTLRFLPDEIEALVRLGELDTAAELLDPFEARSVELNRVWGVATAGRCRGLLLAARGDVDGAQAALDQALEYHAKLTMPFEQGRTLLVAGEILRRARRKTLANTHLQAALEVFGSLGAPLWEERTRSEIERLGLRRAPAGSGLTAAERRVADLAAVGLSNAEIASQLFMSPRTVEAHLSRIYRKMGVNSRTAMSRVHLASD